MYHELKQEFEKESVKHIKIEAGCVNFIFKEADTDKIIVSADIKEENKYNCRMVADELQVLYDKTVHKEGKLSETISITLPMNMEFDNVEIDMGACDTYFESPTNHYRKVDFEGGASSVEIEGLHVDEELNIEFGAGRFNAFHVEAKNMNLSCGAAKAKVEGDLKENVNVDCGVGAVNLLLKGCEADYCFSTDCAIGSISINGKKRGGFASSCSQQSNNARTNVNISCGVGKVTVTTER